MNYRSEAMARPFAVFDIDGTLIRWQLYHALADELAKKGKFDQGQYLTAKRARMDWKRREHDQSFREYEEKLVDTFSKALKKISAVELQQASETVINEYKDQVYTYTRELITELKSKNYLIFAISASQDEIVKMLAAYYQFDDAIGTKYEVREGFFTSKRDLLMSHRKPEVLKDLVAKHGASQQGSIAVGDSESDIPMLSSVDQPIAFNPTKELYEHARENGWNIVVERKNVIYRLEPNERSYQIA
jgi:HAD superfamily hydrolase (TIGR01490 family)